MIKNKETHGFLMILPFKETKVFRPTGTSVLRLIILPFMKLILSL